VAAARAASVVPPLVVNPPTQRVLGWDLLRGLCALAVMAYHLMGWLGLGEWTPLGFYGVYFFFVLSGASLAYVYSDAALGTPRAVAAFLAARWLRLAPLYLALLVTVQAVWIARTLGVQGFAAGPWPITRCLLSQPTSSAAA
jgi:peptidoglycan/LPS O-acetylase OafA/YrhL